MTAERVSLPPELLEAVCEAVFDWAGENDETTGGRPAWDAMTKMVLEVLAEKARIVPLAGLDPEKELEVLGGRIKEVEAKFAEVRKLCTSDRATGSLVAADILDIIGDEKPL